MKPIIEVEKLSKRYALGPHQADILWALRDISFSVAEGEVIGIIGKNGAGKSTLLKILSRITEPTSGRAVLRGRVSSLLEVGTGFHPDLTGRENVYLNGTILGMRKMEIDAKYQMIAGFAELEKFMETPVKHYSSGMRVRLAFSVAAHLEPEIMMIDEVLSVGDIGFQKKCLGKISNVVRSGRTVLVVSHNVGTVQELCGRCFLIHQGRLRSAGEPKTVIEDYLEIVSPAITSDHFTDRHLMGDGTLRIFRAAVLNHKDKPAGSLFYGEPFKIELRVRILKRIEDARLGFLLTDAMGTKIFSCHYPADSPGHAKWEEGIYKLTAEINENILRPGNYCLHVGGHKATLGHVTCFDQIRDAVSFQIIPASHPGSHFRHFDHGLITVNAQWQIEKEIKEPVTC